MKKPIFRLLLCIILLCSSPGIRPVFAMDPGKLITEVTVLKGKLYLSDWNDDEIILTKVRPIKSGDTAGTAAASALEYTAVPVFDSNIWDGRNGSELDLRSLAWFLDMDVRITAVKLADGTYRVESVKIPEK